MYLIHIISAHLCAVTYIWLKYCRLWPMSTNITCILKPQFVLLLEMLHIILLVCFELSAILPRPRNTCLQAAAYFPDNSALWLTGSTLGFPLYRMQIPRICLPSTMWERANCMSCSTGNGYKWVNNLWDTTRNNRWGSINTRNASYALLALFFGKFGHDPCLGVATFTTPSIPYMAT